MSEDKIKKIINNLIELKYPIEFKDKKTIFDDSKIESHSALTPTYKIPKLSTLSDDEKIVYKTNVTTVKTGDNTPIGVWAGILAAAVVIGGAAGIAVKRKKKKYSTRKIIGREHYFRNN